jgi:hypothetical protein
VKPLVYVAGPYSSPDPVENMNRAIKIATGMRTDGVVNVILPHLTGLWHLVDPAPYEDWLDYDLEIMDRCDAVYRFAGKSSGADAEVAAAHERCIPVFHDLPQLYDWARRVALVPPTRYHYGPVGGRALPRIVAAS